MSLNLPPCPPSLKPIAHYIKIAQEHINREPVVPYWACLYALQTGLKLSQKQTDETNFLIAIMEWLENAKKLNETNEAITNEVVAQAYLENYALKLFTFADQQDRASNYGKNVVKAFYTAGMIYDVLNTFGELSEEAIKNSKYAKWKAAYINNCLKNGETPVPGPITDETTEDDEPIDDIENNTEPINPTPSSSLPSPSNEPTASNYGFNPAPIAQNVNNPNTDVAQVSDQTNANDVALTPDQMLKAQKYCKWAGSALNYDDVKSAIDNLQKALNLLQTGQDR